MKDYWLKTNVCIEPLIWEWYAWTHLISPTTVGLHLSKHYLKILQSYITNPDLHFQACQDPQLRGGPYVNFSENKIEEIDQLYFQTMSDSAELIEFSRAIDQLSSDLSRSANGFSLEEMYKNIPEPLRGYVELVYDMHQRANIRLIEPLIYKRYFSKSNQTFLLSTLQTYKRPFILSTPRLGNDQDFKLNLDFSHPSIDLLNRSRTEPCDLEVLQQSLNVSVNEFSNFAKFFTPIEPISNYRPVEESKLRIRYFGHACLLIETKNISILVDPMISYSCEDHIKGFSYLDLPKEIDYVLITHAHQDHIDIETLIQLRHKIKKVIVPRNNNGFIADPSLKLILNNIGFEDVITMNELDEINFIDGSIIGVPFLGEHGDLNIQSKIAYYIRIRNKSFLLAVDSNNIDPNLYIALAKIFGAIDVLFIGMECAGAPISWTYGALFPEKIKRDHDLSRRLNGSNSEKAWLMTQTLQSEEVYVYAMGKEPWLSHIMDIEYTPDSIQMKEANHFINRCTEAGIIAAMPFCKKEWIYSL